MANDKYAPQKKFREKYSKQYNLVCFSNTEQDIIDRLAEIPSKAGYIKDLIRRDIEWYAGTTEHDLVAYPAIFEKEDNGYSVFFPDIEGCFTCGDTIADALYMAQDVLACTIHWNGQDGKPTPPPSDINDVPAPENGFVSMVFCDLNEYKKWDKWYVEKEEESEDGT